MPSQRVAIEGGYDPATGNTGPLVPILVTSGSTPGTAGSTKITDGTVTAGLVQNSLTGNALAVATGTVLSGITINGASGNINGGGVDAGSAKSNWTAYAFPTGTLTGTLTMELSDDGGNWVPAPSVTVSIVAATNVGLFSTGRASRYARVNLSGVAGAGTVTVRMAAAG